MDRGLRKTLRNYTRVIRATPTDPTQRTPKDWNRQSRSILSASRNRDTDHFIEAELYAMQEEKVGLVNELKDSLRIIDRDEDIEASPGAFPVSYNGTLFRVRVNENESDDKFITVGDILIAPEWGVEYNLDPSTVPKWVRKRYALARAKYRVRYLADLQIMHDRTNQAIPERLRDIYTKRLGAHLGKSEEPLGIFVEHLAKSILKRIVIDCDLGIAIEDSDIQKDIEHMTDFIVRKRDSAQRFAISFTTHSPSSPHVKKLEGRADRLNQYTYAKEAKVVVSVNFGESLETVLMKWSADAAHAITPADIVPTDVQAKICDQVFGKVLTDAEHKEAMNRVSHYFGLEQAT